MKFFLFTLLTAALFFSLPSNLANADQACDEIIYPGMTVYLKDPQTGNETKYSDMDLKNWLSSIKKEDALKISYFEDHRYRTPWQFARIPDAKARWAGIYSQIENSLYYVNLNPSLTDAGTDMIGRAQDILSHGLPNLSTFPMHNNRLNELLSTTYPSPPVSAAQSFAICLFYTGLSASACDDSLKYLLGKMRHVTSDITGGPYIYEVVSNLDYGPPLARAASKIFNQALHDDASGDLFSILKAEFVASGFTAAQAEKRTWYSIYTMLMDGQNIWTLAPMEDQGNVLTLFSLAMISASAAYLDAISTSPSLFSFPPGVKVGCDSGKNYHFWISAFLSREAKQTLAASTNASTSSSFITDIGYQINASGYGRDPAYAYQNLWNAPGNQKIRLDLAYASGGSKFGVLAAGSTTSLDLDNMFTTLAKASKKPAPLSADDTNILLSNEAKKFDRWNDIFAPKVLFP